ncbi:hypothetical protein [Bathymodiolus japonicus methanotrophic gill symbiont]|uniref:hypothetical protein n=1 Tax=Bathymodiolus japonicus methanotrophic gill symbiont TaxID=113269 RepID=UPI001C8E59A6|nr:hypothetical protein [Bathymodiolus japonicus methanotrophic gill symbiont]
MATTNGSTAIRDKILASLARYRALRIGKFPCAFWRLSARPGLTAKAASSLLPHWLDGYSECNSCSSRVLLAHVESANCPVAYQGLKITTSLSYVSMIFSDSEALEIRQQQAQKRDRFVNPLFFQARISRISSYTIRAVQNAIITGMSLQCFMSSLVARLVSRPQLIGEH